MNAFQYKVKNEYEIGIFEVFTGMPKTYSFFTLCRKAFFYFEVLLKHSLLVYCEYPILLQIVLLLRKMYNICAYQKVVHPSLINNNCTE